MKNAIENNLESLQTCIKNIPVARRTVLIVQEEPELAASANPVPSWAALRLRHLARLARGTARLAAASDLVRVQPAVGVSAAFTTHAIRAGRALGRDFVAQAAVSGAVGAWDLGRAWCALDWMG